MTAVLSIGVGLVIGLSLGALGGGGSILTVPALVYLLGQTPQAATTGSLVIVGVSALIGAVGHHRAGRVRWGLGLAFGAAGIAAGFLGTAINRMVAPDILLLAFSGLVVFAAAGMFRTAQARRAAEDRTLVPAGTGSPARTTAPVDSVGSPLTRAGKVLGAGLLVGFLTGFFGVGGGFVIVPALTLALGLAMPEAVATSLVVIAINSGAALLFRAASATIDWAVVLPLTAAAVVGSLAGKKVADRVPAAALTRAFAVLLVAVALYTAGRSIAGLVG
jgi:uncharacterized membrane protein YfcA